MKELKAIEPDRDKRFTCTHLQSRKGPAFAGVQYLGADFGEPGKTARLTVQLCRLCAQMMHGLIEGLESRGS